MTTQLKTAYNSGNPDRDNVLTVDTRSPYTRVGGVDGYRPGTIIPHVGGSTRLEETERFKGSVKAEIVSYGNEEFKQLSPTMVLAVSELSKLNNMVAAARDGTVIPMTQPETEPAAKMAEQQPSPQPQDKTVDVSAINAQAMQMLANMFAQMTQQRPTPTVMAPPFDPQPPHFPTYAPPPEQRVPPISYPPTLPSQGYPLPPPNRQQATQPQPRPPFVPVDAPVYVDAFRSLGIPNLSPVAAPPKTRVDFVAVQGRSAVAFSHTTFYHWVAVAGSVILLIADTRFDYPYWAPSDMGDNVFQVTITGSDGQAPQVYDCRLCGAEFMFGNFRFFMLISAPPADSY